MTRRNDKTSFRFQAKLSHYNKITCILRENVETVFDYQVTDPH